MQELIRQLRAFAQGCRGSMWQSRDETIRLMDEAAEALTTAQAEIEALRIAVTQAAEWFEEYADQHAAKAAQAVDSYEQADRKCKAVRNAERAATMRATLSGSQT